jgi:hypothetical protein
MELLKLILETIETNGIGTAILIVVLYIFIKGEFKYPRDNKKNYQ